MMISKKMKILKEKFKQKRSQKPENRIYIKPRYDAVYESGVEWLESLS